MIAALREAGIDAEAAEQLAGTRLLQGDFLQTDMPGAFGEQSRPFVGWLMLLEDAPASRSPVRDTLPHFPVFKEFQGVSYAERYDILCRKLVQEQPYTTASILTSPRSALADGAIADLSDMTGLCTLVTELAGHIAAEATRS
ncbi:MAG: hypothetical protein OXB95_12935 [Rhodobacteraceae bacterium]|nr:hypothetical protein [Paracoccaceae bacterium]